MTSTQLKALQDTLINDNNNGDITPQDIRDVFTELIKKSGGWADYNNSTSTKQSVTLGSWQQLNNDGLGAYTNETFLPYYSSGLFADNEIKLTDLPLGSMLTIRFEIGLDILSNNTDVQFRVKFKNSSGTEVFTSLFDYRSFKATGSLTGVNMYTFYIGSDILNGSASLEVFSDHDINAILSGIFITIP